MRILAVIISLFLCFGCQSASRQLMAEPAATTLAAAPPVQSLQAVSDAVRTPVLAQQPEPAAANDCFDAAFGFMDYWSKSEVTTQVDLSVERDGAMRSSIRYSGALLF